jgi:hypothetical protein
MIRRSTSILATSAPVSFVLPVQEAARANTTRNEVATLASVCIPHRCTGWGTARQMDKCGSDHAWHITFPFNLFGVL